MRQCLRFSRPLAAPTLGKRVGTTRVEYYLAPGRFISHARPGAVFIPSWRARDRQAPYLHETVHVLLFAQPPTSPTGDSAEAGRLAAASPSWLTEGFPDAVAQSAAIALSFPEGDVFGSGGPAKVDSTCAARLQSAHAEEVLPFIGGAGTPTLLLTTERQRVAPIFYACAHSFTRYLIAKTGAPFLASLFPEIRRGRVAATLEARLGQTMVQQRQEWLGQIRENALKAAQ